MKRVLSLALICLLVFSGAVYADNLLWNEKFSEDYAQSVLLPVVYGDYLYSAVEKTVLKIDPVTGETVRRAEILEGETGYAINPPVVEDGVLYFSVGKGKIQAVSAEDLKTLWTGGTGDGQTLTPITVSDGLLFTGTWNGEMREGTYFCLSADDGSLVWSISHKGGFYRAGAYAGDGFLLFGSDDGTASVSEGAVLYSVEPETGEIIDLCEGILGDVRSGICVEGEYAYFTTKGKRLYKVNINHDGTFGDVNFCELGGMSTTTPLIHNGVLYVGVSGATSFGKEGHSMKLVSLQTLEIIEVCPLPGYPQTEGIIVKNDEDVIVYTTCNTPPGGLYAVVFDGEEISCRTVFEPEGDMAEHCISGIVLYNGRLYYKNDSGYVFAVDTGIYEEDEPEISEKPQIPAEPSGKPVNSTIGVYLTVEKFVLGEGFIIPPVFVEITKGEKVSDAVIKAMKEHLGEDSYISTGSADSGFYLSYVKDDMENGNIPDYIMSALKGNIGARADEEYLGEFDYTDQSGWMYCVNNEFPDVGASEYIPENKDVIRWQFTLFGQGADIGADNSQWGENGIVTVADKDRLIKRVADINSLRAFDRLMKIEENRIRYDRAIEVLTDIEATQSAVDEAYEQIKELKKTEEKTETKSEAQQQELIDKEEEKLPEFTDIKGHWAEKYIVELWQKGIVSGKDTSFFGPDDNVSRGELMVLLHRISGDKQKYASEFCDVDEKDYWYNAVGWAQKQGIAGGMGNKRFCPQDSVSREMAAAFLQRFLHNTGYELLKTSKNVLFADHNKISDWATEAVAEMVSTGILNGYENGNFAPLDNATRAQCACMIYKILQEGDCVEK